MFRIALALVVVLAGSAVQAATPNIVFILADDLGINDLGCYGRKEHRTPNLDRLAKDGMRFTSAYAACPVCSPTRAAILTGKSPARLHLTTFLPGRGDATSQKLLHPTMVPQLPLRETTLADSLKTAGYATASIGKWHLGGGGKFSPDKRGFDVVHAGNANTTPSVDEGGKGESDLTRKAIAFVTANRDRPFFLYLCHNTPHIPLGARAELIAKYRDTYHPTYAAMMHEMDESVGQLLKALDDLQLREKTIVVFTSDNGGLHVPELKDDPPTHNTPYRAGKGFLYEGGIRVPLIVRWPGTIAAGAECHTPVISTDWTPTFLALSGVKTDSAFDGVSLGNLMRGEMAKSRPLFWHVPHYTNQGSRPAGAIRDGDWKLIEHYEDSRIELFDLAKDPGETTDIASKFRERATELQKRLTEWRVDVGAQDNRINPTFDPARHKVIYHDTDVSQLKPKTTAKETATAYRNWRTTIDAATRTK